MTTITLNSDLALAIVGAVVFLFGHWLYLLLQPLDSAGLRKRDGSLRDLGFLVILLTTAGGAAVLLCGMGHALLVGFGVL